MHLRDPFLALQQILRLTTETVIMTETIADRFVTPVPRFLRRFKALMEMVKRGNWPVKFYNLLAKESMLFMPRYSELRPAGTWWGQRYRGEEFPHFTVVARRTEES